MKFPVHEDTGINKQVAEAFMSSSNVNIAHRADYFEATHFLTVTILLEDLPASVQEHFKKVAR